LVDPVTALATASAAFNLVKRGFSIGKDIESMGKDLGRWMGAVADIKKAEEYNKKPPIFKKLFASGSIEEEAMQIFMAKKKAEDMRNELKQIIIFSRGPNAWQELLRTEGDIRKKRQKAIFYIIIGMLLIQVNWSLTFEILGHFFLNLANGG